MQRHEQNSSAADDAGMNRVLVFKTDVSQPEDASRIINLLVKQHGRSIDFHFDLDDCDRILRAEAINCEIYPAAIMNCLSQTGFQCEELT